MVKTILALTLLLVGYCTAQDRTLILNNQADVVSILNSAQFEILLATPKHQLLAFNEAMRVALVERGVEVFVLTAEESVFESGSFSPLLSFIAAVRVQEKEAFTESMLIVDRQFLVIGDLLERELNVLDEGLTKAHADEELAERYVNEFLTAWHEARPFEVNEGNIDILFTIGGLDGP